VGDGGKRCYPRNKWRRMTGGVVSNDSFPPAGNPDGNCAVPAEAAAEDVSHPTNVIGIEPRQAARRGSGTGRSQGRRDHLQLWRRPRYDHDDPNRKIFNNTGPKSSSTRRQGDPQWRWQTRILYMNTCDEAQVWTTSHCQDQDHPRLTGAKPYFQGR